MGMHPLAIVTMVRGDHRMMEKWMAHYAPMVQAPTALHVFLHGEDAELARIAQGASVTTLPYDATGAGFEEARRGLFFGTVRALLGYYRHVIVTDSDEFIVLDPQAGSSLGDYLDQRDIAGIALSPLGFDVVHRTADESDGIVFDRPILSQRSFGFADGSYSKPCIFRRPPQSGNQHELKGEDWVIDPNILLFHLRFFDRELGEQVARAREQQTRQFDSHGTRHDIGTWSDRLARLRRAIQQVNDGEPAPLTGEAADAFAARQVANYESRGKRLMWRDSRHGPYRIPERFRGML